MGGFLNADDAYALVAEPMRLDHKNLFAYCDNNPVVRMDNDGEFWDIILDIFSTAISVYDVFKEPTSAVAWASLVADAACIVVQGATGGGAAVKAVSKGDNVTDAAKSIFKGGKNTTKLTSSISKDSRLVKEAQKMGQNQRIQQESNELINQFITGNTNPGIGNKNLFKDINYLRGRNGARVFFRNTSNGIEILAKADKSNEQKVIKILEELYK